MGLLWSLIISICAGWLAGQVMKGSGYGLIGDLIIGVIGSIIGGWVFGLIGIYSGSLLGHLVDECRSLSFYNMSGVNEGFSPLSPIMTALIMWPRQFPFGVVKNVPFARLQRGLVEELSAR